MNLDIYAAKWNSAIILLVTPVLFLLWHPERSYIKNAYKAQSYLLQGSSRTCIPFTLLEMQLNVSQIKRKKQISSKFYINCLHLWKFPKKMAAAFLVEAKVRATVAVTMMSGSHWDRTSAHQTEGGLTVNHKHITPLGWADLQPPAFGSNLPVIMMTLRPISVGLRFICPALDCGLVLGWAWHLSIHQPLKSSCDAVDTISLSTQNHAATWQCYCSHRSFREHN